MKTTRWLTRLTLGMAVLAGVLAGSALSTSRAFGNAEMQKVSMFWHPQTGMGGVEVDGGMARLIRQPNGISWTLNAQQLEPGSAYTVWLVVVNNPEECSSNPCPGPEVLQDPATESQVVYGGGHVVGDSGTVSFGGARRAGPIPNGWLEGGGLNDPMNAEVHFVLMNHGPVLPEFMPDMIKTLRGGCTGENLPGIYPDAAVNDGTPGPNTCRLWQVAIFL